VLAVLTDNHDEKLPESESDNNASLN